MSTTYYFEESLYPPSDHGRADTTNPPTKIEIFRSNYYGNDQIFLRVTDDTGAERSLHLSKAQATDLSRALENVVAYIGYDNT